MNTYVCALYIYDPTCVGLCMYVQLHVYMPQKHFLKILKRNNFLHSFPLFSYLGDKYIEDIHEQFLLHLGLLYVQQDLNLL